MAKKDQHQDNNKNRSHPNPSTADDIDDANQTTEDFLDLYISRKDNHQDKKPDKR